MTSLRLWVALLALTCFLAGLACGPFVSAWFVPPPRTPDPGPFPDYERMLVETFKLGPERQGPLRTLLADYRLEVEGIKDRHMADYMTSMEEELFRMGLRFREKIRDKVLPEAQRSEFDRLARALPARQP